jgi:hypothetical protein
MKNTNGSGYVIYRYNVRTAFQTGLLMNADEMLIF